jgi:7-cyano-7-deazaguanine synthase
MKKAVIPVSGGMDSSILLYYAKKELGFDQIFPLSFNYKQRHHWELGYASIQVEKAQVEPYKEIDVSFIKELVTNSSLTNQAIDVPKTQYIQGHPQPSSHVAFRNMIFLSIACSYAESVGADTVFHGAAQLDTLAGHWDGSNEFLTSINQLISLNRLHKIKIEAPLINKSKKEIIELGIKLGVDFKMTHTCYDPVQKLIGVTDYTSCGYVDILACGKCQACGGRLKGFVDAGYKDPKEYAIEIPWSQYGIVNTI